MNKGRASRPAWQSQVEENLEVPESGILGLAESTSMARIDDLFKLELYDHIPAFVILLESDQERYSHVHRDVLPKLPICNIIKATNAEKKEVEHFLRNLKI